MIALLAGEISPRMEEKRVPDSASSAQLAFPAHLIVAGADRDEPRAELLSTSGTVNRSLVGTSDPDALTAFVREFTGKETTQRSYRKEINRFYLWCLLKRKRLADVDRFDVAAYCDFMRNPPSQFTGPRNRPRLSPEWRPFSAPVTEEGVRYALTVLNSLYNYLGEAGYLQMNPFALIKRKGPRPAKKPDKNIDQVTWALFISTLTELADAARGTWRSSILERELFVCAALYWSACRREELARFRFGDLYRSWERAGDQLEERWRWNVHGKGDKIELIPAPSEMIAAIKRYWGAIPTTPDDAGIFVLRGVRSREDSGAQLCADQVRDIVVSAAKRVSEAIADSHPYEAAVVAKITPHWLRHARTKHLLDAGVDPRYVQRLLRHASMDTTMTYDSTGERAFYEAIAGLKPIRAPQ